MPAPSSDARFFGMDLHAIGRTLSIGWRSLQIRPPFKWLAPSVPVRLFGADGQTAVWRDGRPVKTSGGASQNVAPVRCLAVELPEELVLRRRLVLPAMTEQDTFDAVSLDVQGASPFGVQDVVFGYDLIANNGGTAEVEVILASRKQVQQHLATHAKLAGEPAPEVWAVSTRGTAIVVHGFGEALRHRIGRRWHAVAYGLLVAVFLWLVAIGVTPTAQLRLRAVEAVHAYDRAVATARPVVAQREELLLVTDQLNVLSEIFQSRIEPLRLMDRLTKVLPDDTALQMAKLQAGKVIIMGHTGNASTLMQILSEQPGLRDVKAPSPATRAPGATKENFAIEFTLDSQHYGVAMAPSSARSPVGMGNLANPTSGSDTATAVVNASPPSAAGASGPSGINAAPPSASPAGPGTPQSGAATFGGATFGGNPGSAPSGNPPMPAKRGQAAVSSNR